MIDSLEAFLQDDEDATGAEAALDGHPDQQSAAVQEATSSSTGSIADSQCPRRPQECTAAGGNNTRHAASSKAGGAAHAPSPSQVQLLGSITAGTSLAEVSCLLLQNAADLGAAHVAAAWQQVLKRCSSNEPEAAALAALLIPLTTIHLADMSEAAVQLTLTTISTMRLQLNTATCISWLQQCAIRFPNHPRFITWFIQHQQGPQQLSAWWSACSCSITGPQIAAALAQLTSWRTPAEADSRFKGDAYAGQSVQQQYGQGHQAPHTQQRQAERRRQYKQQDLQALASSMLQHPGLLSQPLSKQQLRQVLRAVECLQLQPGSAWWASLCLHCRSRCPQEQGWVTNWAITSCRSTDELVALAEPLHGTFNSKHISAWLGQLVRMLRSKAWPSSGSSSSSSSSSAAASAAEQASTAGIVPAAQQQNGRISALVSALLSAALQQLPGLAPRELSCISWAALKLHQLLHLDSSAVDALWHLTQRFPAMLLGATAEEVARMLHVMASLQALQPTGREAGRLSLEQQQCQYASGAAAGASARSPQQCWLDSMAGHVSKHVQLYQGQAASLALRSLADLGWSPDAHVVEQMMLQVRCNRPGALVWQRRCAQ